MGQATLEGMPEPAVLRLHTEGGQTLVTLGRTLVYRYDSDDTGMRNLAIVALTDAGRRVDEVAAVFGLSATYVSILRGRARTDGSAGLVRRRGRPPKLTGRQGAQARAWAGQGRCQQAIADRLGVAQSVISELLARLGPTSVQEQLPEPTEQPDEGTAGPAVAEQHCAGQGFAGSARITTGAFPCRYAGAMLLHAYLHAVGAQDIFATLPGGPARRYDDLGILTGTTLGFALGIDTLEGAKHLRREQAGPVVGLMIMPELKTLRTRLPDLADGTDPLAVQRAFASRMLASDPAGDPVYFVADHFVAFAEHLNAYLTDPDEYRAITRHLLHQGGQITYDTTAITVTLDRPDSPPITRALTLLCDELNTTPARLPDDRRAITFQVAPA